MTKPKPPRVLDVEEGCYVAGTHDIDVAIDLLVAEEKILTPYLDHCVPWGSPIPWSPDLPPAEREDLRARARTCWAHIGPCPGGSDEYAWMIFTNDDGPGPGRFKLVWWMY